MGVISSGLGNAAFMRFSRQIRYSGEEQLEAAINDIGRPKVFEEARRRGWASGSEPPPKWVWWDIVRELRELQQKHS